MARLRLQHRLRRPGAGLAVAVLQTRLAGGQENTGLRAVAAEIRAALGITALLRDSAVCLVAVPGRPAARSRALWMVGDRAQGG
ncbi:hypothetical protein AB0F18_33875 [Streptomyces sp. NPDC029216]|uniref:hypothetical protein n=1 Tax=Streptomyces sp. NPDC029216 TaxID=3154701 RepID=UPI003403F881